MIQFILGVIAGLLIGIILLFLDQRREKSLVQRVSDRLGSIKKPAGAILEPPSEIETAREEVIKQNTERGRDTKLEQLDL